MSCNPKIACAIGGIQQLRGPSPAPSNCAGDENWIGDSYCDDENNNAACQFDGGDCCNDDAYSSWDDFCSVSKKGCI